MGLSLNSSLDLTHDAMEVDDTDRHAKPLWNRLAMPGALMTMQ
ncbi:hypothetical protein SynNOUM97013_01032 [Synechococcus sp. NOUM97013]|nr:hypothetical protein SynNOUM97013_01032 [Synechococcus sp. NOUM97013]